MFSCICRKKAKRTKRTNALLEFLHEGLFNVTSYGAAAELLCKGADPFVEYGGYNAFEWSIQSAYEAPLQELLFNYTFDIHFCTKIHLNVLVQLAKTRSPLFHQVLEHNVEVVPDEVDSFDSEIIDDSFRSVNRVSSAMAFANCRHNKLVFRHHVLDFFNLEIDYLKILIEKCNSAICALFKTCLLRPNDFSWILRAIFSVEESLTRLDLILDGGSKMKKLVMGYISGLEAYTVFAFVRGRGEDATSELLLFLMMYGLKLDAYVYYGVYRKFGYCNLFKILLHMEPGTDTNYWYQTYYERNGIFNLIFDVNLDLEYYFYKSMKNEYDVAYPEEVLDYFAHPDLERCLEQYLLSETAKRRIKEHPKIPLLVEISRNVLRKSLIERNRITNSRQFYTVVNNLPISSVHKKIITYETKLY